MGAVVLAAASSVALPPPDVAAESRAALLAAAYLASYSGRTREAYAYDLREWGGWCATAGVGVLDAGRVHVQVWARDLADRGRAPSTVARKLSAVAGFYGYAVAEGELGKSPAVHVRRPHVDQESTRLGLDRGELERLLAAAAAAGPRLHALTCLLAINGLRVSEACGAGPADLEDIRGHRVLTVRRKGGKVADMPLAPRTAAAVDLAGLPLGYDRHSANRAIQQAARSAGISKHISPHSLRHTFATLALDAGVPLHEVQDAMSHADPRTTQRYNRARHRLERHATYAVAQLLEQP